MRKIQEMTIIEYFVVVFSYLESEEEQKNCGETRKAIKEAKSAFIKKAFYLFEFNLKFCDGIRQFKLDENDNILKNDTYIMAFFERWYQSNCSREEEMAIWSDIRSKILIVHISDFH